MATSLLDFDPSIVGRFEAQCVRGHGHFANRVASLMRRMVHVQQRALQQSDQRGLVESEASNGKLLSVAMVVEAMNLVQLVLQLNARRVSVDAVPKGASDASRHRESIARYVASLENDFFEATTIDAAAASLGIPRRTFTKLFAQQTGKTWLRCVREMAIKHAAQRLTETDTPITSVAFECGFNDLSTFYRQFKSQTGLSPAAYRAKSKS